MEQLSARIADIERTQTRLIVNLSKIMTDEYIDKHLYKNAKYSDPTRLNRFEYQVYSQNGEDGIIEEIFNRIGTRNKFFVEFGVENGLQNNTAYLLTKDWTGCWIEANEAWVKEIKQKFNSLIQEKRLLVRQAFITGENIESLLVEAQVPKEFDLLSIDIDGNDYWVWKAIKSYRPKVVVIEYNPMFRPDAKWIMKYNPEAIWNGTSYYGASLKSLEMLGLEKGYKLVGCNFLGVNAFFVREDLVEDKFCAPFTAENHYEPARYHLTRRNGHPRDFGDFTRS
ncbi:MAG: hypothetical protein BBJ57_02495 [Desulfobacterales bacterium PC51MH44]|nr:MAG: hypothetical protein BBJ57_02495 [Desulfobacterales bacterium PC51MH44]